MIAKKVLLIGHFGVGKTSLIQRFVLNEFSENYISSIGVRVSAKIVKVHQEEIKLLIWDIAGTYGEEKIPKSYFLGASACMFVFDLSREETYFDIENQVNFVKNISGLKNILLVGNKKDLVSVEKLVEITKVVPISIDMITSAKDDDNVEEAFIKLTQQSLN